MSILKSALAASLAGAAALAISATAFASTNVAATASASPTPTATPTPKPTPTPIPTAGPLTIVLTCDTGPVGSGTFTVTANSKASTLTVKCGKSATVSNAAWKSGSVALIHQTGVPTGALRARDLSVTLKTTALTVAIRDFRPASTAVATLAQTGGGIPLGPIGLVFAGMLLVGSGSLLLVRRMSTVRR